MRACDHPPTELVEQPARVCSTIGMGGETRRSLRVFCSQHARSMPLDACRACVRRVAEVEGAEGGLPVLTCRVDARAPTAVAPSPLVLAGTTMTTSLVCAAPSTALFHVVRLLPAGPTIVPIVGPEDRFVGIVHVARQVLRAVDLASTMGELMVGQPTVVDEASPLLLALRGMARSRVRMVTVVNAEGVVVGALRDIDAMHRIFG